MSAATATAPMNAEQTGRRVEEVLDRLAASGDPAAATAAEELVRSLMDFYGAGLARILHLLASSAAHRRPHCSVTNWSRACSSCTTCTPRTATPVSPGPSTASGNTPWRSWTSTRRAAR